MRFASQFSPSDQRATIAGLVDTISAPPENSLGLVSKPITIRLSATAHGVLEATANHLGMKLGTLLRMIAETGIEQTRAELASRGVYIDAKIKTAPIVDDQGFIEPNAFQVPPGTYDVEQEGKVEEMKEPMELRYEAEEEEAVA